MSWRTLLSIYTSRHTINKLNAISKKSPFHARSIFQPHHIAPLTTTTTRHLHSQPSSNSLVDPTAILAQRNDDGGDDDGTTNEFLARFAWTMRKRVKEAYPESDKATIDTMLLVIVHRVVSEMDKGLGFGGAATSFRPSSTGDFSEDLWRTVWEVSNKVLEDMNKERKKEKMKGFLQCDEVKEMCRFAGEVGIRGDLLRELRFKWAREKMEEHDFYEDLERIRKEGQVEAIEPERHEGAGVVVDEEKAESEAEAEVKVAELPKRRGKIKFKLYGLDLSDPKWEQVADKTHEAGQAVWPEEAKPITGKCKLVTERIMSLKEEEVEEDNLTTLLAEWVELLQPSRVDWIHLLERLKEQNPPLYFKVAEIILTEDSFQTSISDYYRLIDIYAKENRFDDTERILKKMNENSIGLDASTASALVHMYCKAGNLDRAKEAFEVLTQKGFQPDMKVYNSMIMSYVNAGDPKAGENLMKKMEEKGGIKPTKEIYTALLRAYSQRADVIGAGRISTAMQFAGFQQSMETCTLLIEAHSRAGDPEQARNNFDYMIKFGHKPDDRCVASMIAAYEMKNLLDKALNLLAELEKDGFEPGVATYSVLVDWFSKMNLVYEAEELVNKIALLGEAPPFRIQVSLCDMYARSRMEKKALQTLGVLEARKDELGPHEFQRIIYSLIDGGFQKHAQRMCQIMEAQGFTPSYELKGALQSGIVLPRKRWS